MKEYFVKSLFRGWNEVTKEQYNAYINNIMTHSNMPIEKKNLHL